MHKRCTILLLLALLALPVSASAASRGERLQRAIVRIEHTRAHSAKLGVQMLTNYYSHRCMGVHYGSTSPGALVYQGTCNSSATDQWWNIIFVSNADGGLWQIINNHSHLCLSFNNNSFGNGTAMIQYWCNSSQQYDQVWLNAAPDNQGFYIYHGEVNTVPISVVEDRGYSTSTVPLDEWSYNGGANQRWQ